MPLKNFRWFIEYFSPEEGHLHGIREVLFSKQTPFQSMDILELGSYGKSLVLDGRIQSTIRDEFIKNRITFLLETKALAAAEISRTLNLKLKDTLPYLVSLVGASGSVLSSVAESTSGGGPPGRSR